MKAPRWTAVSPSPFEWEREALDFLRDNLPNHEPWRAWSNFEFIDDEGRVNEVDALVLTPVGLILIEVKSRPGTILGDAYSWTWRTQGQEVTTDNPLPLANRKAKRLASVLRRQEALNGRQGARIAPWVEPLIFLSKVSQSPSLDPGTAKRVVIRGEPGKPDDNGAIGTLLRADDLGLGRRGAVDAAAARQIVRALEQAGVRPPGRGRRVGDYELEQLLGEGDNWQDFAARHAATGVKRRIRVYPYARATTPEARDRLARTAQRESRVLEGLEHRGIQRVLDYREAELGPALLFEYDPAALRLDRFMSRRLPQLALAERLGLVRQLAEAMAYAHGKRLYHRGLAPQSVLVRDADGAAPRLQVTNWQVASRAEGSNAGAMVTAGTLHVEDHITDPSKIYLAPEAATAADAGAGQADVFSLGAIAYHLLSGRPPAASPLELPAKLREGNGLLLSGVMNGVGRWLEEMVRAATTPVVRDRPRDAREFLEYLAEAEREAAPQEPASVFVTDPATAAPGDRLEGGLVIKRRLGQGGSAYAFLVEQVATSEEFVLKVALDDAHADRIRDEADVLRPLRHPNIVRFVADTTIAGRPAILMERAGDRTLAQWIRGGDPLSLDLMRRFGEHLLSAVEYLEQDGVAHRDVKPDNIGIAKAAATGAYRLVLFDFSLSRAPLENVTAGTRPYIDPFLVDRRPPRWDLHAERYAAAITLHEMLVGAPPTFGDGLTEARFTEDEATIAVGRFDPALRDGLEAFFRRALRRDPAERFGNAEEMLRAWREAFSPMDRATAAADSIEVIAPRLDRTSSIAEVGYGVEARAVLDQMGIHTVYQLLGVPRLQFRYLTGVGDRIRKEIRERAKRLAELRRDLVPGGLTEDDGGRASLDRLAEQLLPRRPAGDDRPDDRILAYYLGIDDDAPSWASAGQVAAAVGTSRGAVADALEAARARWHKSADLNAVRGELSTLIETAGGIATVDELAVQLLGSRGSVREDDKERMRRARATIRAAVELEASVTPTLFASYAEARPEAAILVSGSPENAEYARRLGRAVDKLAAETPLPSPGRVDDELGVVPVPEGASALLAERRLRLAIAVSGGGALSARGELYPRGMKALGALKLALGTLANIRALSEGELRARVRGRFPEAEDLPLRPDLDALLEEAGAEVDWRDAGPDGAGYYSRSIADTGSGTAALTRYATYAPAQEPTPDVLAARAIEDKLVFAAEKGVFLALTVEPRAAQRAEAELLRRFPREVVSLERLMLHAMRTRAEERRIAWPKALMADAAARDSTDFKNLLRLAAEAAPRVAKEILALRQPALLTRPGLLARYDLMTMLDAFSQASGASSGPPSLWLLIPQAAPGRPEIDGTILPVISAANWTRLTDPWLANAHRAGGRSAA
jgi:serine/threonine protein kinase